jgi:hypothetical protein
MFIRFLFVKMLLGRFNESRWRLTGWVLGRGGFFAVARPMQRSSQSEPRFEAFHI